jgi:hypothetical protein
MRWQHLTATASSTREMLPLNRGSQIKDERKFWQAGFPSAIFFLRALARGTRWAYVDVARWHSPAKTASIKNLTTFSKA